MTTLVKLWSFQFSPPGLEVKFPSVKVRSNSSSLPDKNLRPVDDNSIGQQTPATCVDKGATAYTKFPPNFAGRDVSIVKVLLCAVLQGKNPPVICSPVV